MVRLYGGQYQEKIRKYYPYRLTAAVVKVFSEISNLKLEGHYIAIAIQLITSSVIIHLLRGQHYCCG